MDVFAWSKLEIWMTVLLSALIVVAGSVQWWQAARPGPGPVIVQAREASADEETAATGPRSPQVQDDTSSDGPEDQLGKGIRDGAGDGVTDGQGPGPGEEGEGAPIVDVRININTAPPSELERLPGIGPVLAARIVAYREKWGPFQAIEDIMEVSGIGPAKFANMRHLIKVE